LIRRAPPSATSSPPRLRHCGLSCRPEGRDGRTPKRVLDARPDAGQTVRAPCSRLWWGRRRSYALFVMRELSSVFVAWFVVYLLLLVGVIRGASTRAIT
jgi:hypothetical protein